MQEWLIRVRDQRRIAHPAKNKPKPVETPGGADLNTAKFRIDARRLAHTTRPPYKSDLSGLTGGPYQGPDGNGSRYTLPSRAGAGKGVAEAETEANGKTGLHFTFRAKGR